MGGFRIIIDAYSLLRDLYEQAWYRSNRAYALRPVLEHYDYTVGNLGGPQRQIAKRAASMVRYSHAAAAAMLISGMMPPRCRLSHRNDASSSRLEVGWF